MAEPGRKLQTLRSGNTNVVPTKVVYPLLLSSPGTRNWATGMAICALFRVICRILCLLFWKRQALHILKPIMVEIKFILW